MSREVRVPDMGDVQEAEVIEVFVHPDQSVAEGEPLVTLESDKAAMDLPAPFSGVVEAVHVSVDEAVQVDTLVVTMSDAPTAAVRAATPPPDDAPATPGQEEPPAPRAPEPKEPPVAPPREESAPPPGSLPHAGPAVRRFARELGVDLAGVTGSGKRGRITREDVQGHVKQILSRLEDRAAPREGPVAPAVDAERFGPTRTEELGRLRRRSGTNLQRNWQLAPHVTQYHEADVTELEARRKQLAEAHPVRLTMTAVALWALARVLREFPRMNSCLSEDGRRLILREYVHIGFAANTDEGLVVPVVRDVDRKSVAGIATEVGELAERARAQQLTAEDMQGGGFTLSNLGGSGAGAFAPLINLPQVAVLGIARARRRPVWRDDGVEGRDLLPLSVSYDHRVIDGVEGARFVVALAGVLEDPGAFDWGLG